GVDFHFDHQCGEAVDADLRKGQAHGDGALRVVGLLVEHPAVAADDGTAGGPVRAAGDLGEAHATFGHALDRGATTGQQFDVFRRALQHLAGVLLDLLRDFVRGAHHAAPRDVGDAARGRAPV